jgi:hypothetical protein
MVFEQNSFAIACTAPILGFATIPDSLVSAAPFLSPLQVPASGKHVHTWRFLDCLRELDWKRSRNGIWDSCWTLVRFNDGSL